MVSPMEVEKGMMVQGSEAANLVDGQNSENCEGCDRKARTASCHHCKRDRNTVDDEAVNASLGVDPVPPSYPAGPGKVSVLLVQSMGLP